MAAAKGKQIKGVLKRIRDYIDRLPEPLQPAALTIYYSAPLLVPASLFYAYTFGAEEPVKLRKVREKTFLEPQIKTLEQLAKQYPHLKYYGDFPLMRAAPKVQRAVEQAILGKPGRAFAVGYTASLLPLLMFAYSHYYGSQPKGLKTLGLITLGIGSGYLAKALYDTVKFRRHAEDIEKLRRALLYSKVRDVKAYTEAVKQLEFKTTAGKFLASGTVGGEAANVVTQVPVELRFRLSPYLYLFGGLTYTTLGLLALRANDIRALARKAKQSLRKLRRRPSLIGKMASAEVSEDVAKELEKTLEPTSYGVRFGPTLFTLGALGTFALSRMPRELSRGELMLISRELLGPTGPHPRVTHAYPVLAHYDPSEHKVSVPFRYPAIAAHEYGHATMIKFRSPALRKLWMNLYALGRLYGQYLLLPAATALAFSDLPEDKRKKLLALAFIPALPTLVEEARASIKGIKALWRLAERGAISGLTKGRVIRSIPSLLGAWSTYGLAAALPLLIPVHAKGKAEEAFKLIEQAETNKS